MDFEEEYNKIVMEEWKKEVAMRKKYDGETEEERDYREDVMISFMTKKERELISPERNGQKKF